MKREEDEVILSAKVDDLKTSLQPQLNLNACQR